MPEFRLERPSRREDAPPPATKRVRRLELPDGEHWVDVRGGQTQMEIAYLQFWLDELQEAARRYAARELSLAEQRALEVEANAAFATWLADRVVDHNLTDADGQPLPTGLDLFWALTGPEAIQLALRIAAKPSIWADPKAETSSSGG